MIIKNKKILLNIFHDFIILSFSFVFALWLRLENEAFILVNSLWPYIVIYSPLTIFFLNRFGFYHGIWKYSSIHEILSIFKSLSASCLIIFATLFLTIRLENIPRSFLVLLFIVSLLGISGPRIFYRLIKDRTENKKSIAKKRKVPVIVVGNNDTTELFIRASREKSSPFNAVGIIGTYSKSIGRTIHGIPILTTTEKIENLKKVILETKIVPQRLIIADHSLSVEIIESLFIFAKKNGLAIGELPKITDFKSNSAEKFKARPIIIEDVLGRQQRIHETDSLKNLSNKIVMVTGAGGSIGSELCKQISTLNPKNLILVEQNEFSLYEISQKIKIRSLPVLGDIRDSFKMEKLISSHKPDIIFHAAALKHITFVESDPIEALKTNFFATVKIIDLCKKYKVPEMIFISTDKAVNPTNIMGATKRLCEKYIQMVGKSYKTNYKIVRFGNVLGSTGSVVPLFEKQINMGGPITITHPEVSRYFMTIREAVELVLLSSQHKNAINSIINVLEMGDPVKIKELALKMISLSGKKINEDVKIKYTKLRNGEKLNEELFYKQEKMRKSQTKGILETNSVIFPSKESEIKELITCIKNNDEKKSIFLLKKILPEYKEKQK